MLQPILFQMPAPLGFGACGSTPANIGNVKNVEMFVVTGVNAWVVGTLGGPGAPILSLSFTSGQSLVLIGQLQETVAAWEAHWTGWMVVPADTLITAVNANSVSLDVIQVSVDGLIPTVIYG